MYDYNQLRADLTALMNEPLDRLTQLDRMFDVLLQHSTLVAREYGRLEALCMLLETAKKRAEMGLSDVEIQEIFAQKAEAKQSLELIDKAYFITNQKVKIQTKINPNE